MQIPQKTYELLPDHLKALFRKLPNHGSDEVLAGFPETVSKWGRATGAGLDINNQVYGSGFKCNRDHDRPAGESGSAARFFYCAKASNRDRGEGNDHPTVKPIKLMEYLVRLITPPGGVVLDPFLGSGTTGVACVIERRGFIGIEQDAHYCEVSAARIKRAQGTACDIPKRVKQYAPTPLFEAVA